MSFSNIIVKNNSLTFDIDNIDKSLVNAIRRIAISEIPTIAFKTEPITENDIHIIVNKSSLHNEFLSHRIGMTPIHIHENDIDTYEYNSNYTFILDINNNTDEIIEVTTEDFKIKKLNGLYLSKTEVKKIFPPDRITGDYMIITRLKPDITGNKQGERIHIEAKAIKETGLKNARWSPVETCSYNFKRDKREGMEQYKIEIAKINDIKKTNNMPILSKKEEEEILRQYEIHNFDRYYMKDNFGEPNSFEFRLISINLSPIYIIHKAMTILIERLHFIKNELENEESKIIEIVDCDNKNIRKCVDIIIKNESHTLGNLLQSYINIYSNNYNSTMVQVDMVGYKCPHPLEKKLILRIKPTLNGENDEDYRNISKNIVLKTCDNLISLIYELITDWNNKQNKEESIIPELSEQSEQSEQSQEIEKKPDIFKEYNEDYKKIEPENEKEKEKEKEKKKLKSKVVKK